MPVPPGERYATCTRLREPEPAPLSEADIQRLWFEESYRNPLQTTTGETVHILQPGFWNKSGGPDFTAACLLNGRGEKQVGAIEIHPSAPDWSHHGHHRDRAYNHVILHVVWQLGPRTFFPTTHSGRSIRQIEFSSQLRLPLPRLRTLFTASPEELATGVRFGRCRQTIATLPNNQIRDLLRDAGWFRFTAKSRSFQTRVALLGYDQALWLGLAEAMGYAENRQPFLCLARRLPIAQLLTLPPAHCEARLYGLAGFLPDRILHLPNPTGQRWLRQLWDGWWKERAEWADEIFPKERWSRQAVRPVNRPERRLAALAALIPLWPKLLHALHQPDLRQAETLLSRLTHPFWSHHLSWRTATRSQPIALLGPERIERILYNVLWPAAWFHHPAPIETLLSKRKATGLNRSIRRATVRLLPPTFPTRWLRELLVQEGLIQIFHDFCLAETEHCAACDFPQLIRTWSATPPHS